jgi:hypothetical protein
MGCNDDRSGLPAILCDFISQFKNTQAIKRLQSASYYLFKKGNRTNNNKQDANDKIK